MTIYHDPNIGPYWVTENEPSNDARRITNEHGVFDVEMTMRGYSIHSYMVRKVSGEWPSPREVAAMCDGISLDYFGFEANIGKDTASVNIYVD